MSDDRMTLTDMASYLQISRPTCYKIVAGRGFPQRGPDAKWDRSAVLAWLSENRLPADTRVVGGGLVVKTEA